MMMSIAEFFSRFRLHDSGVEGAEQRPNEGSFRLKIELCNYEQSFYREGDPETVTGWLEFRGVTEFSAAPPLPSIRWGPSLDGEILVAEVVEPPEDNRHPRAKFVISLMDYQSRAKDVLVIGFRASSASWSVGPRASSPNPDAMV